MTLTARWLDSLTPSLNATAEGQTTLTSIIRSTVPQKSSVQKLESNANVQRRNTLLQLNSVTAALVVDAMSRIGWSDTNIEQLYAGQVSVADDSSCVWQWQAKNWKQIWRSIMAGKATFVPCSEYALTETAWFYWAASVGGYAMKADGTSYYLSLTVLYVHIALVVGHVVYTLIRQRSSSAWSSLTDFLVLSLSSPPPQGAGLKDTCAGVRSRNTRQLQMKVREGQHVAHDEERIQLLMGRADGKRIVEGEKYGAQR